VTPVSAPSVSLSSAAANASGVTYAVGFTTSSSGGLVANQGTVTVSASASGTTFRHSQSANVLDVTTGQSVGNWYPVSGSTDGSSMTYQVTADVPAGHRIRMSIAVVTNPGASTGNTITVSTSSDSATPTGAYAITTVNPVSAPSVSLSSAAANASGVTYALGFTTSSSGGLVANQGTVTVSASASGTTFRHNQYASVLDVTTGQSLGGWYPVSGSTDGNSMTYQVGNDVPAGHRIRMSIPVVTNPGASTGNTISVSTSSDSGTATAPYTIGAAKAPSGGAVQLSNTAASASNVTYSVDFTTSATGGLVANQGAISISAPSGTGFPNNYISVFDVTTGQDLGTTGYPNASGSALTWKVGQDVPAGHEIRLTITGVTNPSAATYQLAIQTSSDSVSASSRYYTVGSQQAVSSPTVALSNSSPSATNVTYTIGLRASASGALTAGFGTITADAPAGTVFTSGAVAVNDLTAGGSVNTNNTTLSNGGATATWTVGGGVPAGHLIQITATGVTNPSATGTYQLDLVSSSDTLTAQTPSYSIGSVAAPTVTSVAPTEGPSVGGTPVTINGTGFTGASRVNFGQTVVSSGFTVNGAGTQITVNSPAGSAGTVDVTVTAPGGISQMNVNDRFTYDSAPTVTGVSPSAGPTAGGTSVTITGTGFTSGATVQFGPNAATNVVFNSATSISAKAPASTAAGIVDVTVTTLGGQSQTGAGDNFTYADPPTVSSIAPSQGSSAGGTTVTITGTNFTNGSTVNFGSTAASLVSVNSTTQMTATSPVGAPGAVDVTVTTVGGTSATGAADRFTYNAPPPQSIPPSASTQAPSHVSPTKADLSGQVNPRGLATTAHFEYGLDAKYRHAAADLRAADSGVVYNQSTPDQSIGSDTSSHPVFAAIDGLVPNALYHVRLVATNPAGTTYGPDQTFMTAPDAAPPPPPVLGKTENVKPVSGVVFIKPPPGKTLYAGDPPARAPDKGQGFLPLTEARQIPVGSQVDSRLGSLQLVAATAQKRQTQAIVLAGGLFSLLQERSGKDKGLTTFNLLEDVFAGGPSYKGCAHAAADSPLAQAAVSKRVLQTLHARDKHGRFRTRGRYSAATVRGTDWDTIDRCDGTLTVVHRGTVLVTDFRRNVTIPVTAGKSYLAKAR
jgi:uncharacterized RmlC-like cupin family protein